MVDSDFRIYGDANGEYYPSTERIVIYLNNHETYEDILSTITHEYLHHCITSTGEIIDDQQEERIIFIISWADYYLP
tara:strand:- start:57 stop:287 length:231 start_codon:yes stop_codon:yes gene_type:complete